MLITWKEPNGNLVTLEMMPVSRAIVRDNQITLLGYPEEDGNCYVDSECRFADHDTAVDVHREISNRWIGEDSLFNVADWLEAKEEIT